MTDRQRDRSSDHATRSAIIGRNCIHSTAMWPNNNNNNANKHSNHDSSTVTASSRSMLIGARCVLYKLRQLYNKHTQTPLSPTQPQLFYCHFVITLHNAQSLLVCSSSISFSILCILFLEKSLIPLSLVRYAQLHHTAPTGVAN